MRGRGATLRRAPGIEDPLRPDTVELRKMRVPVQDRLAVWKPRRQPCFAPGPRPRVVHQSESPPVDLDNPLARESVRDRGLVHVAVHAFNRRPERLELRDERERDEVAEMQDQISRTEPLDASRWKPARAARQVRVGDDCDVRRPLFTGP